MTNDDFEVHEIGTQNRLDLYDEVFHTAKRLRELDNLTRTMIIRDSRRQAESLLDLAISNYEDTL